MGVRCAWSLSMYLHLLGRSDSARNSLHHYIENLLYSFVELETESRASERGLSHSPMWPHPPFETCYFEVGPYRAADAAILIPQPSNSCWNHRPVPPGPALKLWVL